jgi:hypothetical protein
MPEPEEKDGRVTLRVRGRGRYFFFGKKSLFDFLVLAFAFVEAWRLFAQYAFIRRPTARRAAVLM